LEEAAATCAAVRAPLLTRRSEISLLMLESHPRPLLLSSRGVRPFYRDEYSKQNEAVRELSYR
jgi:hypothetical protein